MAPKTKTFDCVEMKHQAQAEIMAEWERRKSEFPTYAAFLEASVRESPWCQKIWERACRNKLPART